MRRALLLLFVASCGGKAQPKPAAKTEIPIPPPEDRHYQLVAHVSAAEAQREWPKIEQTLADLAKPPPRTPENAGYLDELTHLHPEARPFPTALIVGDCATLPGRDKYEVVDHVCAFVPVREATAQHTARGVPGTTVYNWGEGNPDELFSMCDVTTDGVLEGPPRNCEQIGILSSPPMMRVRVWKRDRHILQPPAPPLPELSMTIANEASDAAALRDKAVAALTAAPLALHLSGSAAFAGPRASDLIPGTLEHVQLDFVMTQAPTGVELTATLTLYLSTADAPGSFRLATPDERRTVLNAVSAALTTSLEPYCLSAWDERGDRTHLIWRC